MDRDSLFAAEAQLLAKITATVQFKLRELNTVRVDGNSFHGPYDQKFFDADGHLVAEDNGVIHATRLSVDQF